MTYSYALLAAPGGSVGGFDLVESASDLLEDLASLGVPVSELVSIPVEDEPAVEFVADALALGEVGASEVLALLRRERDSYRVLYAAEGAVELLRSLAEEAFSVVPGRLFRPRGGDDAR